SLGQFLPPHPMSKPRTYAEYDPNRVALAESALLTLWNSLGEFHNEIVLVGGLVPKYLCAEVKGPQEIPRPSTLDVDVGIAVTADRAHAQSLYHRLKEQGFEWSADEDSNRFVKTLGGIEIYIDFLAEDPRLMEYGSISYGLIHVSQIPGIRRALESPRMVSVSGVDLDGRHRTMPIRVCEAGPFLALKLRAFLRRRENKDAFDIYYTIRNYVDGPQAAALGFAAEASRENTAFPDALQCLLHLYADEDSPGPVATADFILSKRAAGEDEEAVENRLRLRQQAVDGALLLLRRLNR
ncbi:MAG: hypothetical protein JWO82_1431, partial [Akkermansiaceae bacterium]|nr:hypothetical protein [Akkermansiaceae bacterium]